MQTIRAMRTLRIRQLATMAVVATLLAACNAKMPVQAGGPDTGAKLSVINGGAGTVRVVVDGSARISSLAAASISDAINVGAGLHTVELQAIAGGGLTGTSSAQVAAKANGTTFVTAHSDLSGTVVAAVVGDSGAVPAPGMSKLRVIDLARSMPVVDVWRTQPDYTTPIRTMFPFPYNAQTPYLQSTPGAWEVIVTTAHPPTPGEPDPRLAALATFTLTIGADVARTVVILDKPGGGLVVSLLDGN